MMKDVLVSVVRTAWKVLPCKKEGGDDATGDRDEQVTMGFSPEGRTRVETPCPELWAPNYFGEAWPIRAGFLVSTFRRVFFWCSTTASFSARGGQKNGVAEKLAFDTEKKTPNPVN